MALPWFRWDGADLILQLHVQPRASREGFAGVSERGLKVRLTAAPTDGQANEALQTLLSHEFGVPKSRVSLDRGATGRHKQVRIAAPSKLPPDLPLSKP
jgi:uncharacterized protein